MIAKSVTEDIVGPTKTIYWEDFIKTGYFKKIYTAQLMKGKFDSLKFENKNLRERYLPTFKEDCSKVEELIAKHHYFGYYISHRFLTLCEKTIKPIASMMKVVDDFVAKYNYYIPLIGAVKEYGLSARDEASVVWFLKFEKVRLKNKYYLKSEAQLAEEARERTFKQRLGVIFQTINQPTSL